MANFDYILKSGAKLHITTAPFEVSIALVEAVKRASKGQDAQSDVGDTVLMNPEVRKALYPAFEFATYENIRIGVTLFDDPKLGERARGDYFEIGSKVIEINCKPFFLRISSESTESLKNRTENPE